MTYDHQTDQADGHERQGTRPRRRSEHPEYKRSVFERPEIRALVADLVQEKVSALQEREDFGVQFVIHQLDEVVNELRGSL